MLCCPTIVYQGSTCIKVSHMGCTYAIVTLKDLLIELRTHRNAIVPQNTKLSERPNPPKTLVQWGKDDSHF
jgi:hypothetical protein